MDHRLFKESGSYQPTFFYSRIHTYEELGNLGTLSDEAKSTFLHEYIHFIQDLTTYYGLMNIHLNVDILKYYNQEILKSGSGIIELPLPIDSSTATGINIDLYSYYLGDATNINSIDILTVESQQDGLIEAYPTLEHYVIELIDSAGNKEEFIFGAAAILESMAHEIECFYFPQEELGDAPYKMVRKLIEFYGLDLSDPRNIVALCDVSLGHSHPAQFLIFLLKKIRKGEIQIDTPYDFYRNMNDISFKHPNRSAAQSFKAVFDQQLEDSKRQLKDYFTIEHFNPLKEWIDDIFKNASNIKNQDFGILITLLNTCNVDEFINYFLRRIGCPLLSNDDDKFWFHNIKHKDNQQIPALKIISDIQSLIRYGDPVCDLQKFCKKNHSKDITDANCSSSPWERASYDQLCYFGQVFKMWGLGGKEYVIKD